LGIRRDQPSAIAMNEIALVVEVDEKRIKKIKKISAW